MPQSFEQIGLSELDGMVWFRREFDLPEKLLGKTLTLDLGPVDDIDTTWVNGVKVGQMNRVELVRSYPVPTNVLKAGRNVIAVRVLDTGGNGGLVGQPGQLRLTVAGEQPANGISLTGMWKMHDSAPSSQLSGMPPIVSENNPNVPTVLYNGMIAPLLPFAIKGAIWYQGESNAGRARQYQRLLPAMIGDWRARFGVGNFPFYIVQLAAFQATYPEPRDSDWAELREAQALSAQRVGNAGLAVAIDIGDANDIHPKDKQSIGHRLALSALAKTYDRKIESSGPWYRSMKLTDDGIRLKFDHVDGGLLVKGDRLAGFAIAGSDRKFVWADAVIQNDTVLASSPKVFQPIAVRYAWDINPVCNLYNQSGLPAVPFRTDTWTKTTSEPK
jgi:sialate O-acetylesterase